MSGTGILPLSGIAATNSNNEIRVYFQAYNGHLRESGTNDDKNWNTTKDHLPAPVKPKTFTPIAAANYDNLRQIRVYYLDGHSQISELAWDGSKWFAGELNNIKVISASYSKLAVVHYGNQFRVYYQESTNNNIKELVRDGTKPWTQGHTLPAGLPGTDIAAVHTKDGTTFVYYQGPNKEDNITNQASIKDGKVDVKVVKPAQSPPHGGLAAITFGSHEIRLYDQPQTSNVLREISGPADVASISQNNLGALVPLSSLAAVTWGDIKAIRVYRQTKGSDIVEKRWDSGRGWTDGVTVPTQ